MAISREALEAGGVDLSDVVDATAVPLAPIAPGELLREEWLEPLGITAYRLAKDIDVPPNRVTAILAGERAITADTALRLARYFGTDAQSWMNLPGPAMILPWNGARTVKKLRALFGRAWRRKSHEAGMEAP